MAFPEFVPVFRAFYTFLAKIKLSSEEPPENVPLETYVAKLNEAMPGLGLRAKDVQPNRPRRAFGKDTSNIGLGKQRGWKEEEEEERGWEETHNNALVRPLQENSLKTRKQNDTCLTSPIGWP